VFVIGLVASVSSCIAVTGGLLVAVAAKYNEANAHLTDVERLKPHLAFNVGRILSYTLLGGAIGALGSALTLSSELNGILTLAASGIMIILGLQMLKLVSIRRIIPTLPTSFAHRIYDLAGRETTGAAFLLGASTFFLPCGFTQALQLYVLAKGTFATGALTMLAFVLGTLPALLSLSALSSFAKGAFQERFLKFAGAAVVLLGFLNIQYGLVLAGSGAFAPSTSIATEVGQTKEQTAIAPTIGPIQQNGSAIEPQRITMRVVDFDYLPNQFTVTQGVLVQWAIDASQAVGCGRYLMAPGLGIRKLLSGDGTTLISFTPDRAGEFAFNCGMGMMTPDSKIVVVAKAKG
jgi:sulfite exporter TauE/SafE